MSIPDVVWDGTGKHAARIVTALRAAGSLTRIRPTHTPEEAS